MVATCLINLTCYLSCLRWNILTSHYFTLLPLAQIFRVASWIVPSSHTTSEIFRYILAWNRTYILWLSKVCSMYILNLVSSQSTWQIVYCPLVFWKDDSQVPFPSLQWYNVDSEQINVADRFVHLDSTIKPILSRVATTCLRLKHVL